MPDGSRHAWLAGRPALDLIVTMDDATSEIYSAFLTEEEGTDSTFPGPVEVFGRHGLPLSLYTDCGSHYFRTPEAGGKVGRDNPTRVGRALAQPGIEHIAAYSPEARGRSERMFRTLQERLPKEMSLAGIATAAAANARLRDTYTPSHNARFAAKAEQERSAFVAAAALREGGGEGAPLPGRPGCDLPRPALPGALRVRRHTGRRGGDGIAGCVPTSREGRVTGGSGQSG